MGNSLPSNRLSVDTPLSPLADVLAWLRLTLVPGVSLRAQRALLEQFGTAQAALDAPLSAIVSVIGVEPARLLAEGPAPALVEASLRWLARSGCHLIPVNDVRYPQALLQIADPPPVLYAQGRIDLLAAPALAIVGSRNASPQGARDAQALARALSDAGLAIVSGLAIGIDAAAHRGGLAGGGSSIAVLGTGPDIIYPRRNRDLAHALAGQGCVISEFPVGTRALPGNFPRRNRLISGMSRAVLVVEAALPSGSLSTAKCALDQNRDVFAVPGSIHSPLSKGCHWLIKEGAKLVESAEDALRELRMEAVLAPAPVAPRPSAQPDPIIDAMGFAPATVDQIAQRTGLDAATLAARLAQLEIDEGVAALPGGWFQRIDKRVV